MTHARARLWTGITGVGLVVLLSTAALLLDLPSRWLPSSPVGLGREAAALAAVLLLQVLILAPVDFVSGYWLPRRHGRSAPALGRFLSSWLRGLVMQGGIVTLLLLGVLLAGRAAGPLGGMAAFGGGMVLLLLLQEPVARLVGSLDRFEPTAVEARTIAARWDVRLPPLIAVRAEASAFSGGPVGWPGRERFVVSQRWLETLSPTALAVLLTRWASTLESGGRRKGVFLALAWNLAGFALASRVPGAGLTSVAELVTLGLAFTLWSFLGLLTLPSLTRPAVFAADARALERGAPAEDLALAVRRQDAWGDDEPSRPGAVETVFHPIPSVERRLNPRKAVASGASGPWHAARMALFLSWAGFGFLARAVHCNGGRPELWVLLPGD